MQGNGPPVYADELLATLAGKRLARGYRQLVAFVEACESGSIFEGMLVNFLSIFATTAANDRESSWGTYCPSALLLHHWQRMLVRKIIHSSQEGHAAALHTHLCWHGHRSKTCLRTPLYGCFCCHTLHPLAPES